MGRAHDDHGTKGERRETKRRRQRRALRMHGASLRRIYRDAVLKRAASLKPQAPGDAAPTSAESPPTT